MVKDKGVTVSPGEKHDDEACASLTGEPLIEPRGGTYVLSIGDTGPPKTILEGGTVVGTCCTEVAMGEVVPDVTEV